MERGTKCEARAVRKRWRDLERQRRRRHRIASRGFGSVFLLLVGLTSLLLFLAEEACIVAGPWPHGCMPVISSPIEHALGLLVSLGVVSGLWLAWTAFRV